MSAPAFTPGPWKLDAEDPRYIRSVKTKEYIACRQSANPDDGPILRAAPELYKALADVVREAQQVEYDDGPAVAELAWQVIERARAALAKAVQP